MDGRHAVKPISFRQKRQRAVVCHHSPSPNLRPRSDKIRHFPTHLAIFTPEIGSSENSWRPTRVPGPAPMPCPANLACFFFDAQSAQRFSCSRADGMPPGAIRPAKRAQPAPSPLHAARALRKHHARRAGHPWRMEMASGPRRSAVRPGPAERARAESSTCGYFRKNPTLSDTLRVFGSSRYLSALASAARLPFKTKHLRQIGFVFSKNRVPSRSPAARQCWVTAGGGTPSSSGTLIIATSQVSTNRTPLQPIQTKTPTSKLASFRAKPITHNPSPTTPTPRYTGPSNGTSHPTASYL